MVDMSEMVTSYITQYVPEAGQALDVGAGTGALASTISRSLGIHFVGIEPSIKADSIEIDGVTIIRASANDIPFEHDSFDVVTFTSVYEHIRPEQRGKSLEEIARVLKRGGVLIGQIPNMYFPIEPHSRLPLTSYMPRKLAVWYHARFSPVSDGLPRISWFRVSARSLARDARRAGLRIASFQNYSRIDYAPRDVIALSARWASSVTRLIPLGYAFVFVKPWRDSSGDEAAS
jgi:SAM-dependent methyltransferase